MEQCRHWGTIFFSAILHQLLKNSVSFQSNLRFSKYSESEFRFLLFTYNLFLFEGSFLWFKVSVQRCDSAQKVTIKFIDWSGIYNSWKIQRKCSVLNRSHTQTSNMFWSSNFDERSVIGSWRYLFHWEYSSTQHPRNSRFVEPWHNKSLRSGYVGWLLHTVFLNKVIRNYLACRIFYSSDAFRRTTASSGKPKLFPHSSPLTSWFRILLIPHFPRSDKFSSGHQFEFQIFQINCLAPLELL